MKLFCVFHRRMVALGYHVHCDQNKRTQRLFKTLDSCYRVTVAEWPLWCFPLPTDTDTELSRTFGPYGLGTMVTKFRSRICTGPALNSLRLSDAIRWHRSGSILTHTMARCLAAPSHCLNQCWLILSKFQWHPFEGHLTRDTSAVNQKY